MGEVVIKFTEDENQDLIGALLEAIYERKNVIREIYECEADDMDVSIDKHKSVISRYRQLKEKITVAGVK